MSRTDGSSRVSAMYAGQCLAETRSEGSEWPG